MKTCHSFGMKKNETFVTIVSLLKLEGNLFRGVSGVDKILGDILSLNVCPSYDGFKILCSWVNTIIL